MNEKLINYLKMQIKLKKLTTEQVTEKYPDIKEKLKENT